MSQAPQVRRADKLMSDPQVRELLAHGFAGRLGTVGADGWPYVVPLLYVWMNDEIWVHNSGGQGHLRANADHSPKVCFELDEPGEIFPYGRFECDTSVAYRSVIAFGRIRVVEDRPHKEAFFTALMQKYADPAWDRPQSFFPRLDQVTVYAVAVERLTGKETALPAMADRWPALDLTKSPDATP